MTKLDDLEPLFEEHVASSTEKQEQLSRLIGDFAWRFEMPTGLMTFTRNEEIKTTAVQLLGTQSFLTGTWLWAWGNEQIAIPEDLLGAADHLHEVGERDQLPSFLTPELVIDPDDGHRLAIIACGMLQAPGYYRGPYENGAAFFLLQETEWAVEERVHAAARISALFPEVIARFEIKNQARALRGHLRYHGAIIVQDLRDRVVAELPNGDVIRATFDALGRMTELQAELRP